MAQFSDGDVVRIVTRLRLRSETPDKEGGERVISAQRYPDLGCTPH